MSGETNPIDIRETQTAPRLAISPMWKDPKTGALYVHQDLVRVQEPWAEEAHVGPMSVTEKFGDVESFVEYVRRYGRSSNARPFLTWNARGLQAVLDYAISPATPTSNNIPGRCQWRAAHPFETSREWKAWDSFACGQAMTQRQAVEHLEDLSESIVEPAAADLMNLLRGLRATVNAKADTELRADGTTSVAFAQDSAVRSKAGEVTLPSHIAIRIPVLNGHLNEDGRPVLYRLDVRLRVSVDDNAHLAFRFTIPNSERVLEATYEDRIALAKSLLGDDYELLRAAD